MRLLREAACRALRSALLCGFVAATSASAASAQERLYGAPPPDIEARLDRLVAAYPEHLAGHDGVTLTWRDGTTMPISDGRADKTWTEFLNNPDIDDMLATPYRLGPLTAPGFREDPGRIRYEPFFTKMYGDCRRGGLSRRRIAWVGGAAVSVTTVNGIDARLERVARALEQLPPAMRRMTVPSAGVFNCRVIAGTTRLSVHSFAAAIDLNVNFANYWRWTRAPADDPLNPLPWRNQIPREIVEIFEAEGFIWGGRWYHYDTMHFEYRPELLPG